MLAQHSGKRATRRWRSLATPLPVSDEMGLERLFGRNHLEQGPLGALEKRSRSSENSLQCKEGVLCPLGLLVGVTRGTGGVSWVSPWGRWQSVCCLGSLLQELIKLCRKQIDLSETQRVLRVHQCYIFNQYKGENEQNVTRLSYWNRNTLWSVYTFTGHPFLWGISFLLGREKRHNIHILAETISNGVVFVSKDKKQTLVNSVKSVVQGKMPVTFTLSVMHPSTLFSVEDNKEHSWAQRHNPHMHMLRKLIMPVLTRLSLAPC